MVVLAEFARIVDYIASLQSSSANLVSLEWIVINTVMPVQLYIVYWRY